MNANALLHPLGPTSQLSIDDVPARVAGRLVARSSSMNTSNTRSTMRMSVHMSPISREDVSEISIDEFRKEVHVRECMVNICMDELMDGCKQVNIAFLLWCGACRLFQLRSTDRRWTCG